MLRPAYTRMLIGGPTIVAPVLVLLAANAFGGLGFGTRARTITLGALAFTTALAVFLSGTRGAWLGLAVALVVVGGVAALMHRDRLSGLWADRRVRIGAVAVVVAGLVAVLIASPAILSRLDRGSDGGRAYYFATAQRMFEDAPLVGPGARQLGGASHRLHRAR